MLCVSQRRGVRDDRFKFVDRCAKYWSVSDENVHNECCCVRNDVRASEKDFSPTGAGVSEIIECSRHSGGSFTTADSMWENVEQVKLSSLFQVCEMHIFIICLCNCHQVNSTECRRASWPSAYCMDWTTSLFDARGPVPRDYDPPMTEYNHYS